MPLAVIGLQLALNLSDQWGVVGYSLYKVCFVVLPLVYCRKYGVDLVRDILKFHNWRRGLPTAVGLGVLAVSIFWGVYLALGDLLLDKTLIVEKLGEQFSVTAGTVLVIAPITIFANSFLEELFYRGFAFGRLVQKRRALGYILPAFVFTVQHACFMYRWLSAVPFAIAVVSLCVFACVLQWIYERADSIVAPWVIHICGDVAMMSIAVTLLWH